jgi:hypothetical protein
MTNGHSPANWRLAQWPMHILFIACLAVLLSGCSLYKKVYKEDPFIQVKQGFYKPEVVDGVKGRYVTLRVWNYSAKTVKFDLHISNAIHPGGTGNPLQRGVLERLNRKA